MVILFYIVPYKIEKECLANCFQSKILNDKLLSGKLSKCLYIHSYTHIITSSARGGRKGLRYCGIGSFLVRCCGNFYFKVRYYGFQSPSGLR